MTPRNSALRAASTIEALTLLTLLLIAVPLKHLNGYQGATRHGSARPTIDAPRPRKSQRHSDTRRFGVRPLHRMASITKGMPTTDLTGKPCRIFDLSISVLRFVGFARYWYHFNSCQSVREWSLQ